MGLLDLIKALRPRLPVIPNLRPKKPAIWLVDAEPESKDYDEFQFVFLIEERDETGTLLANRFGTEMEIDGEDTFLKQVRQEKTEVGSHLLPVRVLQVLHRSEVSISNPDANDEFFQLPESLTDTPLPVVEFTPEVREQIEEQF